MNKSKELQDLLALEKDLNLHDIMIDSDDDLSQDDWEILLGENSMKRNALIVLMSKLSNSNPKEYTDWLAGKFDEPQSN